LSTDNDRLTDRVSIPGPILFEVLPPFISRRVRVVDGGGGGLNAAGDRGGGGGGGGGLLEAGWEWKLVWLAAMEAVGLVTRVRLVERGRGMFLPVTGGRDRLD
jgi:hypothetical protein